MAFVVPRVITTVREESAFFTMGVAATPLAMSRFDALAPNTTQASIVLLNLPRTRPICYKVLCRNSKSNLKG